jgi:hypothetical protein
MKCFSQVDYFKKSLMQTENLFQQAIAKLKEVSVEYFDLKRRVLDYHYQVGRLKALLHVSQKYKEESEKATEELKMKVKAVRNVMEGVDLRLIECFHNVVIGKRTQTTYFEAFG